MKRGSRARSRLCRLAVGWVIVDIDRAGHSRGLLMLARKQETLRPFVSRSITLKTLVKFLVGVCISCVRMFKNVTIRR